MGGGLPKLGEDRTSNAAALGWIELDSVNVAALPPFGVRSSPVLTLPARARWDIWAAHDGSWAGALLAAYDLTQLGGSAPNGSDFPGGTATRGWLLSNSCRGLVVSGRAAPVIVFATQPSADPEFELRYTGQLKLSAYGYDVACTSRGGAYVTEGVDGTAFARGIVSRIYAEGAPGAVASVAGQLLSVNGTLDYQPPLDSLVNPPLEFFGTTLFRVEYYP